jgi:hypothetical protein
MIQFPTRQTRRRNAAHGLRRVLVAATALAGGMFSLDALTSPVWAQGVLLAPIGSHRPPGEAVPVYAGADLGQDAPSPLAVPPALSRPTPLAPDATPSTAPVPDAALPATPRMVEGQSEPVAAPAPPPSGQNAENLNAQEYKRVAAPRPRVGAARPMPTVEPGQTPVFPGEPTGVPSPQPLYAGRPVLPDDMRYRPRSSEAQSYYRAPGQPAGAALPGDDGPLLPPAAPGAVPVAPVAGVPPRPVPYAQSGASPTLTNGPASPGFGTGGYDPITQQIDRSIAELRASLAPSVNVGADYLGHSGQSGESKLNAYSTPIEAVFTPSGTGQMKLTVTPVMLNSGKVTGSDASLQGFGTMALGLKAPYVVGSTYYPPAYTGARPATQNAFGTALDLRYSLGFVSADIGTSPLGFKEQNIVGGVELAPSLTDSTRLRVTAERRAVTESLLSYGGTTDPRTGTTWGGVVKSSGKVSLETTQGLWNIYLLAGGGIYTGTHVKTNSEYEVGSGATYPIWKYDREEIRTGIDLHFSAFDKNLRYFSLGQGGYFSPQSFLTAVVPITYKYEWSKDLSYQLNGAVGYQQFREKGTPYFPDDPALQSALAAVTGDPLLTSVYSGQHTSGITGGASGQIDYHVTPSFSVGARASYQKAGVYEEYGGGLYGKYIFNGWYGK